MITLDKVSRRYGETVAVSELSLEVNDGEVCVLIGPSGCGKTTTLRMINRLIEPTSGSIYINGKDTSTFHPDQLRRTIGYAIQSVGLFPHLTVAGNISVVPELLKWKKERIHNRVQELLKLVNLNPSEYSGKYPGQLSGGEAQRIGVARALAADPPILLMDEPFGAVDPLTRERLQSQFLHIQAELKKTVILVTHDLDEAIRLADRIAIMEKGRLIQYDTPENILSQPANKFVHDFVGSDRALKRLSRLKIADFVKKAPSLREDESLEKAREACEQFRWVWITDSENRIKGWIDMKNLAGAASITDAIVPGFSEDIAVTGGSTLKEALSRMLGQGLRSIPVIDDDSKFLGEVNLRDIEEATAESEA